MDRGQALAESEFLPPDVRGETPATAYGGFSVRPHEDELTAFLNNLLEDVRAMARTLSALKATADGAAFAPELDQLAEAEAASCVTLWREVESRGAEASDATSPLYVLARQHRNFYRRLAIVLEAEQALLRRLRDSLPKIRNPRLEARLWRVLEREEHTMQRLIILSR